MRLILLFVIIPIRLISQTVTVDFDVKSNACINENLKISNTSLGVISQEWDFCESDLKATPQYVSDAVILDQVVSPIDLRLKNDSDNWYSFLCDGDGNKLIRFSFGGSLTDTPSQDVIGPFPLPSGLELVKLDRYKKV